MLNMGTFTCNNCGEIKHNFPGGRGQLSELLQASMEVSKRSTNVLNIYYVSDSVVRVKNTKTNRTIEALKMSYRWWIEA